jgi:hypothetical protein
MHAFVRTLLLLSVLAPLAASAQMLQDQPPPQHRLVHRNLFIIRNTPLGVGIDSRLSYRYRLYKSESPALRDNFLGVGAASLLSPAFVRVGPYAEFNPLSVFSVWATAQYIKYFGTFDLVQGFPGAQSDFSDSAIERNAANHQAAHGWELTLGASFQAKVSNIVFRNQVRMIRGDLKLRPGERIYYDQLYDVGAPNKGWFLTNDVDLMYQTRGNKLLVGARYTITAPFYDEAKHFDPESPVTSVHNGSQRLGPSIAYTFKNEDGARFNTPTVLLIAQWWLRHRFRTGADSSGALPVVGVGFQTTGDLLPIK